MGVISRIEGHSILSKTDPQFQCAPGLNIRDCDSADWICTSSWMSDLSNGIGGGMIQAAHIVVRERTSMVSARS